MGFRAQGGRPVVAIQVAPNSVASNNVYLLPYSLEGRGQKSGTGLRERQSRCERAGSCWRLPDRAVSWLPQQPEAPPSLGSWPPSAFQTHRCHQLLPPSPHCTSDSDPPPPSDEYPVSAQGQPIVQAHLLTSRSLIPSAKSLCHGRSHMHRSQGLGQGCLGPLSSHHCGACKTTLRLGSSRGGGRGQIEKGAGEMQGCEGGILTMLHSCTVRQPFL